MTAVTHNIQEMAVPLKQSLANEFPHFNSQAVALVPPKPLIPDQESSKITQMNWPHHSIAEEDLLQTKEEDEEVKVKEVIEEKNELDIEATHNQNEMYQDLTEDIEKKESFEEDVKDNWGIDDFELPEEPISKTNVQAKNQVKESEVAVLPLPDKIIEAVKNSNKIGDLVACGLFEHAIDTLRKQIGVSNIVPFKQIFLDIYMGNSILLSSIPFADPLELRLLDDKRESAPLSIVTMNLVENELKAAYKLTTEGSFYEAILKFRRILLLIPMMMIQKTKERDDAMLLIRICLEYIMGLRCEVSRKQANVNYNF